MSEHKSRYELWLEEQDNPKEKRCSKCKKVKPLNEYHKRRKSALGVVSQCKLCISEQHRKFKDRSDRFWKRFDTSTRMHGNCREWIGAYSNGKPMCTWEYKSAPVRRIVYRLACGELNDDMIVTTTCENTRCVRHSHLKVVTREQFEVRRQHSIASGDKHGARLHPECLARGERHGARLHPECLARGEQHGSAKLSAADIPVIRSLHKDKGLDKTSIAKMMNVSRSTIRDILNGITWAHVQ